MDRTMKVSDVVQLNRMGRKHAALLGCDQIDQKVTLSTPGWQAAKHFIGQHSIGISANLFDVRRR